MLRKTKLGEADLILTMLAENGTQLRCVAKGARKPKGRFSGRFELLGEVDVVVYEGKSLGTITDVTVVSSNAGCRRDLELLSYASVVAQFAEKSTFEGQENPILYRLTQAVITALGESDVAFAPFIVAAYLIKAAAYMGLRPSFDDCVSCGAPRVNGVQPDDSGVDGARLESAQPDRGGAFSIAAGGWVCSDCADYSGTRGTRGGHGGSDFDTFGIASDDVLEPAVAEWVRALMGLRFSEIPTQEALVVPGSSYLAGALLGFCEKWLQAHLGLRLKTMSYLSVLH